MQFSSAKIDNSPSLFARPSHRSFEELKSLSDEGLMAALQAGCNDALTILFDRYHRLVLRIALKIVRDPAESEDVMQSLFLEVLRSAAQFDPAKGTTKVWLLQYAYHRAINRRRQLNARDFYSRTNLEDFTIDMCEPTPLSSRFTQQELKRLLQQGLATLTSQQKRVVQLASYSGLSMKEIAEKTGDSLSNVRHYYYRGLEKLRSFVVRKPERKAGGISRL